MQDGAVIPGGNVTEAGDDSLRAGERNGESIDVPCIRDPDGGARGRRGRGSHHGDHLVARGERARHGCLTGSP